MKLVSFIVLIISISACNLTKHPICDDKQNKMFTIGKVSFSLPNCYEVYYPDTINYPGQGFIMKDGCYKLSFNTGGLGSIEGIETDSLSADKYTIQKDSINNYLKIIGYNHFEKAEFWTAVVDISRKEQSPIKILFDDSLNYFDNHRYQYLFSAGSNDPSVEICLTNKEEQTFINAFMKLTIK